MIQKLFRGKFNQFSRRNLPTETKLALAYRFKEFETEKAKERQLASLKQFSKQEESAELSQSTDRLALTPRQTGTAKRIMLYHLLHLRLVLA